MLNAVAAFAESENRKLVDRVTEQAEMAIREVMSNGGNILQFPLPLTISEEELIQVAYRLIDVGYSVTCKTMRVVRTDTGWRTDRELVIDFNPRRRKYPIQATGANASLNPLNEKLAARQRRFKRIYRIKLAGMLVVTTVACQLLYEIFVWARM